ncbi:MAG: CRISPR-associated endoribonuclease Cas6, partial [Aquificota bacterium]
MRFLVRLENPEETSIPLDYRRRFISLMKRVFGVREFIENPVRPYTFAVYLGKEINFSRDAIEGVKFVNLRISTGDPVYGVKLYNGLTELRGKVHKIGEAEFVLKDVRLEKEGDWSKGAFKTLSPVVVERAGANEGNPKLRYALPLERDFQEVLFENTIRRFRAIKGYEPEVKAFSFRLIHYKEEMVRHYGGYI